MSQNETKSGQRPQLSSAKRALLEHRLRGALSPAAPAIPRRPDPGAAPLSFSQERLWFRDRLEPGNPAYNRPVALRLARELNVPVLERALSEVVRRHQTLRASFPTIDGQPKQVFAPPQTIAIPVTPLERWPDEEREERARRLATEEAQRPFDLADGPLFRVSLMRLGPEEHLLLAVVHHIVFDGWSAQVLLREIGTLYAAFSEDRASPLSEPPIQYADYAHWQREQLRGAVLDSELAYWERVFDGNPQPLNLPTDKPRPTVLSFRGGRQLLKIPGSLADSLRSLSQQEGVTLYVSLLAGFQALLSHLSGQQDILVCTPVANRERVELEGLIGYFNNIIVMRTDLSGDPTYRDLLQRVHKVVMGAYDHQNLPFQMLAELPSLTHTPLSRALFALQNFPSEAPPLAGLVTTPFQFDKGATDFELSLFVEQRGSGLTAILEHKTELFDASSATRMLRQFVGILERALVDPGLSISSLLVDPEFKANHKTPNLSAVPAREGAQPARLTPSRARPALESAFVEPRDDLERRVSGIWEEVLGVKPVGVRDSFFDLGGNSLLAMRLLAQIEGVCGTVTSLASFFQTPTVEQIARILRAEMATDQSALDVQQDKPRSTLMRDTFWRGMKNRVLQVLALYAPGFKTTRVRLHRMRGVQIGENVAIGTSVLIETAYPQLVSIGNNVSISMRSVIVAHFRESTDKAKVGQGPSVRIEDDVYIGAGSIILPNLTIGRGAVVTAGSVVSQSIPPLTMVQGNPARPVALCGVPLAGSSYGDFVRNLKPLDS